MTRVHRALEMYYIRTHNDEITNELSQEQKLEYGSIIHKEDTNDYIIK